MSLPNIPNINPEITITKDNAINLILSSIAMQELGLSHVINAEGEKLQFILGTIPGLSGPHATIPDVLAVNISTAMYALPSSLNVNKDTRLFVSPQGNVGNIVVLKGRGNVVSHAIDPQLSPLLVDFSLTFIERDKKTFFRMVISTSDGSFRHDSGLVKGVSGDLKITSTAVA